MMRGPHRQIVLKLQIDSFYKDEPSLTFLTMVNACIESFIIPAQTRGLQMHMRMVFDRVKGDCPTPMP